MDKQINTLNYRIVGNGYPVVFLHGFLESNQMWKGLLTHFPKIQAILIELPGHGKSNLLEDALSLNNISEAVEKTIQKITTKNFSIVGHSLGGYVALHLAELEKLKIDDIVLLHSHPWADSETKKIDRGRAAKVVKHSKVLFLKESIPRLYYKPERFEAKVIQLVKEANEMTEVAIVQTLYAMRDREDKNEVLKEWKNKIHIIQGEFDTLIDARLMRQQAEKCGNVFHIIKDIGHMGHHENKKEVIKLLNFLQK